MNVAELIQLLNSMPQDAEVVVGTDSPGQTTATVVSLEPGQGGVYVFIGDY